jgi:hypothetical protein
VAGRILAELSGKLPGTPVESNAAYAARFGVCAATVAKAKAALARNGIIARHGRGYRTVADLTAGTGPAAVPGTRRS